MEDIFTIEKNWDTNKKVRVYWEDIGEELDGDAGHASWKLYAIDGQGEDGSIWEGTIQGDWNSGNWENEIYDAEMVDPPGSLTTQYLEPWLFKMYIGYTGKWDMDGKMIENTEGLKNRKHMHVKEWFDALFGKFPNIDLKKGPLQKESIEHLKNYPGAKSQRLIGHLMKKDLYDIINNKNNNFAVEKINGKKVIGLSSMGIIKNNVKNFHNYRHYSDKDKKDAVISHLIGEWQGVGTRQPY